MGDFSALQLFLLANVFLVGVIVAIAVQHAVAHFRKHEPAAKPVKQPQLPPELKKELLELAHVNYRRILDNSAAELQHELSMTSDQLNKHLEKLSSEIVGDEMKRYRVGLDQLREQAAGIIGEAQADVAKQQAALSETIASEQTKLEQTLSARREEMEAQLQAEFTQRRQLLLSQIDTKLNDAVVTYLAETLGHNVDLGAQTEYLVSMLDEHKAELKKELE